MSIGRLSFVLPSALSLSLSLSYLAKRNQSPLRSFERNPDEKPRERDIENIEVYTCIVGIAMNENETAISALCVKGYLYIVIYV